MKFYEVFPRPAVPGKKGGMKMGQQVDAGAAAGIENDWVEARINMDAIDRLDMKLAHVDAMLATICGTGFESFSGWSDEIRGNFLWGCSQIVAECREAAGAIMQLQKRDTGNIATAIPAISATQP